MDIRTIELRIARGENLPVLPQVVSALFRIAEDPNCSPKDLENLIEQDPALTAKILRVVNSPMYAVGNVNTVGRALNVLGTNRVRSLMTSIALQNLVAERQQATHFDKLDFWRHSLAVATSARIIAESRDPLHLEEIYVAGILHDIGLLLMDKFCPDQLDLVIKYAEQERIAFCAAEPNVIAFTHAELGGTMARKWGLGNFLADAIEHHHKPAEEASESAAIIQAADVISHHIGFRNQLPEVSYELTEDLLTVVGLTPEKFEAMRSKVSEELEHIERALAIAAGPAKSSTSGWGTRLSA